MTIHFCGVCLSIIIFCCGMEEIDRGYPLGVYRLSGVTVSHIASPVVLLLNMHA